MARYALIVGINHGFGRESANLGNCVANATAIHGLLLSGGRYLGVNVRMLLNEEATKTAVADRMGEIVDRARPGDTILFSASSHGSRIPDRSGDETDALDEVICLAGCLAPGHDFESDCISDDEIADWVSALPTEINIIGIPDTCHSGTGSRSLALTRYLPNPDLALGAVGDGQTSRRLGRSIHAERRGVWMPACLASETANDRPSFGDGLVAAVRAARGLSVPPPLAHVHAEARALLSAWRVSQTPELEASEACALRPFSDWF